MNAQPQFVEVKPRHGSHASPSPPKLHRLSVSGGAPGGLSVAAPGQHSGHMQGGLPPGSPLLEAYRVSNFFPVCTVFIVVRHVARAICSLGVSHS